MTQHNVCAPLCLLRGYKYRAMNFVMCFLSPARSRASFTFLPVAYAEIQWQPCVVVLGSRCQGRATAGPGASLTYFPRQNGQDPRARALWCHDNRSQLPKLWRQASWTT